MCCFLHDISLNLPVSRYWKIDIHIRILLANLTCLCVFLWGKTGNLAQSLMRCEQQDCY
jgi:hypothetical protein